MPNYDLDLNVHKDKKTGFALNNTLRKQIFQKLKTLFLTMPKERLFNAPMGIGIQTFLFSTNFGDPGIYSAITNRIQEQVETYMPYVIIQDIDFGGIDNNPHALYIRVLFEVPILNIEDTMVVSSSESGRAEVEFTSGPS